MSRALWLLLLADTAALGQSAAPDPIHWAYSAYFGTGRYQIETGDSVYVLSARPGKRWRAAALDESTGRRSIGLELRVPITIGAYRFDAADLDATLRLDNVSTLSAVPGLEIDIPINTRWSLKPLVYAGWGTELDGDASAAIYWGGLKSRLRFGTGALRWALVNSLTYVGYSSDDDGRADVLPFLTGFEFERPLAMKKLDGKPVHLHWHFAYTNYLDEVELEPSRTGLAVVEVAEEWEIGAAFSTTEEPLRLWRLRWDRVGLAYRFSGDGDFEGVSLVFRSLFDR